MKNRMSVLGRALLLQAVLYLVATLGMYLLPQNVRESAAVSVLLKIAVFLPPIILYIKQSGYRINEALAVKKQSRYAVFFEYLVGLCLTVTVMNVFGFLTSLAIGGEQASGGFENMTDAAVSFVTGIILAPILEERLFRGAFFHASHGMNGTVQIVMSGLLFALMHYSLLQFFYAFAAGVVIAFFYKMNGSLVYAVWLHRGANLVTWLFTFARMKADTAVSETVAAVIFAVIAVAGATVLAVRRKKTYENEECDVFIYISPEVGLYIVAAILLAVFI